ncbi:unnamed protein product [Caenorhabditis bovis]|uniref:Protein kinase domain-containing protein n=1 Tax=Caenorhabditis bovis TaxID=2654633 RepID=A0A8S1FB12_9PELO|nr:unnamed protein product [Caenorhabditis bovis]
MSTKSGLSSSTEQLIPIVSLSISGNFTTPPIAVTKHSAVYKVYSQIHRRPVAVKIINKNAIPPNDAEKFLPRELDITLKVRHPHLSRCLCIMQPVPSKIAIISDFYERGTLLDLILKEKRLKEHPLAITLFRQLIEGVHYLHERKIAHRDVKLENILVDGNGDIKLTDFGFARHIERRERSRSFCGTKPYISSQISRLRPYDAFAADYFACGVVLYTMVVGKWPYSIHSPVSLFPDDLPTVACRRLIMSLLEENELCRAGYDECVNSEWMGAHPHWVFANHAFFYEQVQEPPFEFASDESTSRTTSTKAFKLGAGESSMALDKHLFELKFAAKQLEKSAQRCEKEEKVEKDKLTAAIKKGNKEVAQVHAENAIRKKNEAVNYIKMAARIDAVAARVQTAATQKRVTTSMSGVVKAMESAMKSMNLEKVQQLMDRFERDFEDLDVTTKTMEKTMDGTTVLNAPKSQVDALIAEAADKAGIELNQELPGNVPTSVPASSQSVSEDTDLTSRLAALRNM